MDEYTLVGHNWLYTDAHIENIPFCHRRYSQYPSCHAQNILQNPAGTHLHHRLMKIGYSQKTTFALLWFLAFLGVIIGTTLNAGSDFVSICVFLIALVFLPTLLTLKEKFHH